MSNTGYQFPPSSPLIDNDNGDKENHDPFSFKKDSKYDKFEFRSTRQDDYPTPNPSSALFRSSSPSRAPPDIDSDIFKFDKASININSDFNVLNPDKSVVRIPLLQDKSHFSIGRSSRSCEFALNPQDSRISRVHLKVSYSSEDIILTCIGANGVAICIPRDCLVLATSSANDFIIMENKTGVSLDKALIPVENRSIKLDGSTTEFYIRQHETITMPKFHNIMLEISKQVILLNPKDVDEELTDDETPVLIHRTPLNRALLNKLPDTPSKPKPSLTVPSEVEDTPSKANTIQIATPEPGDKATPLQHPTPTVASKPFNIFQDKTSNDSPAKRSTTASPRLPLSDKTNTSNIKRKAQSEEPQSTPVSKKKKIKHEKQEKPTVTQESVAELPNISEINNILINHLAFSRLSSTPASFLNTISVITSKLSLAQIRQILHDIPCIGVIYRQGKDAAGKPLQEEYYYMPEQDHDEDRKMLVANMKGHGGLRSCRKTHKQYYWKKPAPIKK
ncbi:TOS4 [[Candida] subhashii]|uniref:TOS4 n=1 Tax=[Candida] subhashii TaxID=561895 RepID=A0A8J5URC2_9ASCO|nr:TOS4 [[Candida] subhashii]KAG7665431.1 TOS4 [[Candida] subhashii]